MIELWAVIGMASIDSKFRDDVVEAAKDQDREKLYDCFQKQYNFRLSRYEVEELRRIFGFQDVIDSMERIGSRWGRRCSTGYVYKDDYRHPDPGWADTHVFTVEASSGEVEKIG